METPMDRDFECSPCVTGAQDLLKGKWYRLGAGDSHVEIVSFDPK
jgi:hypothetical protein